MAVFNNSDTYKQEMHEQVMVTGVVKDNIDWTDDSMKGIVKAITWPKLPKALKLTVFCLIASVIIAVVLNAYSFGIHELLANFVHLGHEH